MPDFKAYLRNCIDSFFNTSSNRQLMSGASYPSSSNPITVASKEDASDGWKIIATYTAPCDGVITVEGTTPAKTATNCYLWIGGSCFKSASFMQATGANVGNQVSAILKKGAQCRIDAETMTNVNIKFYKSQGSV